MAKPEMLRVSFSSKRQSKKFFAALMSKADSKTLLGLSAKIRIPYGRLRLWARNERTIPLSIVRELESRFGISVSSYKQETEDMRITLKRASMKGTSRLREKLGKDWSKIIAKRGKLSLEKRLGNEPELRQRWRSSILASLKSKYGENPYVELGKLGGPKSIASVPKEIMAKRLEKAFRNSFRKRIIYFGRRFRSRKEVEVAGVLRKLKLPYKYEKKILGVYPDFSVKSNTIIEVVGFDWKFHVEKTREKIKKYKETGFDVVVYTYPNMQKYFDDLDVSVFCNEKELYDFLGLRNREMFDLDASEMHR